MVSPTPCAIDLEATTPKSVLSRDAFGAPRPIPPCPQAVVEQKCPPHSIVQFANHGAKAEPDAQPNAAFDIVCIGLNPPREQGEAVLSRAGGRAAAAGRGPRWLSEARGRGGIEEGGGRSEFLQVLRALPGV